MRPFACRTVFLSPTLRALEDRPPFSFSSLRQASPPPDRPADRSSKPRSEAARGQLLDVLGGLSFGDISCSMGATMKPLLAPGYLPAKRFCYRSSRAPFCLFFSFELRSQLRSLFISQLAKQPEQKRRWRQ